MSKITNAAWHAPQSIYNFGHQEAKSLFHVPVQLQEKVDGSFFAFGLFPSSMLVGGEWVEDLDTLELKVRSKGAVMNTDAPEALFKKAVTTVKAMQDQLHPGWQYRGEVLAKPKHNALAYDRVPKDNIILFDVCIGEEEYLPYEELKAEAERLNLEVVPQLFTGKVTSADQFRQYLETTSILGGQKIEGVVVKPLEPMYGRDKKMLFGKFVSEAFKEVHRKAWGESNPGTGDIIAILGATYANGARYQKALIHLRERGLIEGAPKDIGKLILEIPEDVLKEHEDEIKEVLFKHAWPHIRRIITKEVPNWYKDQLLRLQFEREAFDESKTGTEVSL